MGQKRCSYCYGFGHNRRTCPARPQESKDARKQQLARHRADYGRPKVGSNRKCSQCGEKGHNRKTCNEYKTLAVKAQDLTFRKAELTRKLLNKNGITVGAVICKSERLYEAGVGCYDITSEPVETTWLVTGIAWRNFDSTQTYVQVIKTKRLGKQEVTGKFEDGSIRPVQVGAAELETASLPLLAGVTIEDAKEINDTCHVYDGAVYGSSVHTAESKSFALDQWESELDSRGYDEERKANKLNELAEGYSKTLMVLPGCCPTKKLSNKEKNLLTSTYGYERMYIDGNKKNPFNKQRIDAVERFVNHLEKLVK